MDKTKCGSVSLCTPQEYGEEKVPMFSQYLEVAVEAGTSVIFDVREPHVDHPYHGEYINLTLEVLVYSGIDMGKVSAHSCTLKYTIQWYI